MKLRIDNQKGFTLIEMLVVIALTVIVMGLIFSPIMQTFRMTHRAEIVIRAQDDARLALAQVSRDLNEAMYVYDNTQNPINMPVINKDGNAAVAEVYYAKVDMVLPRMNGYCPLDHKVFDRGDEAAPTCPDDGTRLELRPVQPLTPDTLIVRYFIGLSDPSKAYHNRYITKTSSAPDNMYVLYRVEFNPYSDKLFDQSKSLADNLKDPNFFYNSAYSANWRKIARPVVSLNGTDMIKVEFDASGNPMVTPTVRFAPTSVYNDPLLPTTGVADDREQGKVPAPVFKATYGNWVQPYEVTLSRSGVDYTTRPFDFGDGTTHMGIYKNGVNIFDITQYLKDQSLSRYVTPSGNPEIAFTVDSRRGMVNFAFPVFDQGASTASGISVSKVVDTAVVNSEYIAAQSGTFTDVYRRVKINEPGTDLVPILNATVVPSSIRVIAPNAEPGTSNGPVIYSRLPYFVMDPGVNQFTLDPAYPVVDSTGTLVSGKEGTAAVYLHSVQSMSGPSNDALPPGNIYLYYEVQNNRLGDKLYANYVTKSLMTVTLGIRIYDPATGDPQSVQLTNKIRLKNVAN